METFKIETDSLSQDQMELLQGGGSLKASVKSVDDFRMRDNISGQVISVTAEEIDNKLSDPTVPTLCGNAIARGYMSISFDGGEMSFPAKTSYSRFAPLTKSNVENTAVGDRKLLPDVGDVCESIDQFIGACANDSTTCWVQFTRKKRIEKQVCLSVQK